MLIVFFHGASAWDSCARSGKEPLSVYCIVSTTCLKSSISMPRSTPANESEITIREDLHHLIQWAPHAISSYFSDQLID